MTTFADHIAAFADDITRLHALMRDNLSTDVRLIDDMREDYLVGGKRVRAIVAMQSGRLCGLDTTVGDITAAAIEFIHTATLLHDDVIDKATTRRHLPAAAQVYGNAAAVLAGDFLYSRASQMFANIGNIALLTAIADTTNQLAEGEILQLLNRGKPDMDEATYLTIINRKTANLFQIAAEAAAILGEHPTAPLAAYGRHLGVAFQLIDDCLDYEGDTQDTGKKIGADFSEGKTTLPIILMLDRIAEEKRQTLIDGWQQQQSNTFTETLHLVRETGALADTRARAETESAAAMRALESYPDSPARQALMTLAESAPQRTA